MYNIYYDSIIGMCFPSKYQIITDASIKKFIIKDEDASLLPTALSSSLEVGDSEVLQPNTALDKEADQQLGELSSISTRS